MRKLLVVWIMFGLPVLGYGDMVDISTLGWNDGDTSGSQLVGANLVSFNFGGNLAYQSQPNPGTTLKPGQPTPLVASGTNGFDDALLWRIDSSSPPGDVATLTISFSVPVTGVSFKMGDIDAGSDVTADPNGNVGLWQDQVFISSTPATSSSANAVGSTVEEDTDGNIYASAGSDTISLVGIGQGLNNDLTDTGNAEVSIAGPLTSIAIDYRPGLFNDPGDPDADGLRGIAPANPTSQWVSLHDVNFSTVPEPSSFLFLGLIGSIFAVSNRRSVWSVIRSRLGG